ncbi:hypothetical protein OS493_004253 [Desmophyllum pertusum]|uniref:FAD dependent oxidoreductase domain-containing protein n=1 Tax=Desmophyllum pertusum TaxID=174260 RepID=A0A9W9ZSY6_9CNID|nr:hypothetical protein OS493_004253 [Desmophyllum pertusum]
MVVEARQMWKQIEAKAQQEIMITNVGMLTVEGGPGSNLEQIIKSLSAAGESYEVLSSQKLKQRFPELSFPPHYTAVLEHSAGILKADKCLRVLQEQFVEFGGTLKDGESVVEVHPGSLVTIKTTKNLFTARKVIFTAGSWTNKLLKPLGITLPLKATKATVLYWKAKQPGTYSLQIGFPTYYDCSESEGMRLYGIPSFEYPDLVKFGPSGACVLPEICKEIDPDARDQHRDFVEVLIQRNKGIPAEALSSSWITENQP